MLTQKLEIDLSTALLNAERNRRTKVFLGRQDRTSRNRLPHDLYVTHIRQLRGVIDVYRLLSFLDDLVDHGRRRGDEIEVVFPLEALLDDFHVQHAQKTAPKTKAQSIRGLGLIK